MRRALLVGVDAYSFAPLAGCVSDAVRVSEMLARHDDGTPNFACKSLLAGPALVDRANLRESVQELFAHAADVALLYFAGHGTVNNLGGHLVTQDAKKYDEGVAMADVLSWANVAPVKERIIILDCCHSGAFGAIPHFGNDAALLSEGVSVLSGSRATQSSVEIDGAGVFTSLIVDALHGGSADVLGYVTVASVYAYVDQALGAWEQRPLFKAHVSRLIPLRKCKPVVDAAVLRLLPQYFPDPFKVLQLDPSYEPSSLPHDEQKEGAFANLQQLRDSRLVEVVGSDHLYYAAMESKACRLTPLGRSYWELANRGTL